MAFEQNLQCFTALAGADLSAKQFYFVRLSATGTIELCDTEGELPCGILQNKPTSGQPAQVAYAGVSKLELGGTVDSNDEVMTDANGKGKAAAGAATPGNFIVGSMLAGGGVSGDIQSVLLMNLGFYNTTADTHAASDGSSHTFIDQDVTSGASPVFAVTNMTGSAAGLDSDATTHIASTGIDHSYIQDNLVQVVITAAGGTGGATAGTISVQVNDLAGTAITRAVNIMLRISDTNLAGSLDAAGTCQFGAASTGTLVAGSGGAAAIVTTDATGLYEGALSNAADETNYFSAATTDGGSATAAGSCVVTQCAVASATWSA